LNFNGFFHF